MTNSDHKLLDYETSLGQELTRYSLDDNDSVSQWISKIRLQPISLNTLMYRHLIVRQLLEREIFLPIDSPLLYQFIGSLYYKDPRFSILENHPVWWSISQGSPVINTLRLERPVLCSINTELANRDDVTIYRLDTDHAILSSFTLLYSFHILESMLDFELAIRPDTKVKVIRSNLTHTLDQLRGVFFHVKN